MCACVHELIGADGLTPLTVFSCFFDVMCSESCSLSGGSEVKRKLLKVSSDSLYRRFV